MLSSEHRKTRNDQSLGSKPGVIEPNLAVGCHN